MLKPEIGAYDAPQVKFYCIKNIGLFCASNVSDMDYVSGSWVTEEE